MFNKPPSSGRFGRKRRPGDSPPLQLNPMSAILTLLKPLIGKNVPSLARSLVTLAGSSLVTYGLLSPESQQDGLQVSELVLVPFGVLMVAGSRFTNWMRAKQLGGRSMDKVGDYLGALLGRSIHSATRAAMTAVAGWLAAKDLVPATTTGDDLTQVDVWPIVGAGLLWLVGRVYSYLQEGRERDGIRPPAN